MPRVPGHNRSLQLPAVPTSRSASSTLLFIADTIDSSRESNFYLNHARLDYRMHNKLLVADNSIALVGGRNIGDQYFQIDPQSQFADDDVFVTGPTVRDLSGTFDEFWNSALAIPAEALHRLHKHPRRHDAATDKLDHSGVDYRPKLESGEPLAGILAGRSPLVWAEARVVCDSPNKQKAGDLPGVGSLLYEPVAHAIASVQSELLIISPYVVPSKGELHLLEDRLHHQVKIRILTNSLESAPNCPPNPATCTTGRRC